MKFLFLLCNQFIYLAIVDEIEELTGGSKDVAQHASSDSGLASNSSRQRGDSHGSSHSRSGSKFDYCFY